jgi:glycosyltransferase involved in cell wall biosynthesis
MTPAAGNTVSVEMHEGQTPQKRLTWALCIPTLDRVEVIEKAIACALAQTIPPIEIVIVDAGDDWQSNAVRLTPLLAPHPQIRFIYKNSPVRSSSYQRNIALPEATADIVFMLDDDTFMHPGCAETILSVYEADSTARIAGVTAPNDRISPFSTTDLVQKVSGQRSVGLAGLLVGSLLGRWFLREVLLMHSLRVFVPYDQERPIGVYQQLPDLGIDNITLAFSMAGFAMTVRREIALREPFDPFLRAYCPLEDTDATYRYSRHGFLVVAGQARLHHFEVSNARLKRTKVAALFLLNAAYLIRKHSKFPETHRRRFVALARRRILAELLKDTLSRRWSLPQVVGTLYAIKHAPSIFAHAEADLGEWYISKQNEILSWK